MTKSRKIFYWASTGWIAFSFVLSGMFDVLQHPSAMEVSRALGYPAYFMVILGTWKVLGGIAIAAPGTPRLKEWAYAGIVFDLSSAVISHLVSENYSAKVIAPIVFLGLTAVSWALRPADRKLEERRSAPASRAHAVHQQPAFGA